jgi:TolB protein
VRRPIASLLLAVAALVAASAVAGPAFAAQAGPCTNITCVDRDRPLFFTGLENGLQVRRLDSDGGGATVTLDLPHNVLPSVNRDRTKIAYINTRQTDLGITSTLMVTDVSHGVSPLSVVKGMNVTSVSMSPDGAKVAFAGSVGKPASHEEIYVVGATGGVVTQLTGGSVDEAPAWSPDGSKIAFSRASAGGMFKVYVMNPNGAQITAVTGQDARHPAWSPDGRSIAYSTAIRDKDQEIYWTPVDHFLPHRITTRAGFDDNPTWSPDGTRIAFDDQAPWVGANINIANSHVRVANVDGSNLKQLTEPGATPDWGYPVVPPVTTQ